MLTEGQRAKRETATKGKGWMRKAESRCLGWELSENSIAGTFYSVDVYAWAVCLPSSAGEVLTRVCVS